MSQLFRCPQYVTVVVEHYSSPQRWEVPLICWVFAV
jgi:hypothetical protein